MTDQVKLQRLFEAALKDSSDFNKPFTRAFPTPQARVAGPVVVVQAQPELVEPPVVEARVEPLANAGLNETDSAELGALLQEQQQRKTRKRRREALITLSVLVAVIGGGCGWFVQSPQRIQALNEAIRDIRSVGDVTSMVAKYQASLDKVAVRSKQIDQATEAMGVSSNEADEKDPNMEAEMLAMMGGEGKTTGQRNQMLQKSFGNKDATKAPSANAKMTEANSFATAP
jgi:hypothetical protein